MKKDIMEELDEIGEKAKAIAKKIEDNKKSFSPLAIEIFEEFAHLLEETQDRYHDVIIEIGLKALLMNVKENFIQNLEDLKDKPERKKN